MVTGQQVYNLALSLMDEVTDSGLISPDDNPDYYKTKATQFLTILQAELLPLSTEPTIISDLSQPLAVTDRVALKVLPYGLAANMLLSEGATGDSATKASFFNARYDELKAKMPTSSVPITDNYGVLGGMQ